MFNSYWMINEWMKRSCSTSKDPQQVKSVAKPRWSQAILTPKLMCIWPCQAAFSSFSGRGKEGKETPTTGESFKGISLVSGKEVPSRECYPCPLALNVLQDLSWTAHLTFDSKMSSYSISVLKDQYWGCRVHREKLIKSWSIWTADMVSWLRCFSFCPPLPLSSFLFLTEKFPQTWEQQRTGVQWSNGVFWGPMENGSPPCTSWV